MTRVSTIFKVRGFECLTVLSHNQMGIEFTNFQNDTTVGRYEVVSELLLQHSRCLPRRLRRWAKDRAAARLPRGAHHHATNRRPRTSELLRPRKNPWTHLRRSSAAGRTRRDQTRFPGRRKSQRKKKRNNLSTQLQLGTLLDL